MSKTTSTVSKKAPGTAHPGQLKHDLQLSSRYSPEKHQTSNSVDRKFESGFSVTSNNFKSRASYLCELNVPH